LIKILIFRMNTPGSVNTVYFDTVSHFTTDEIDNAMQSSQELPPAVNADNKADMYDMPPPVHTTSGPLHPALVNTTGTATTFQLHDDGPATASNAILKGKGKERSGSPIPVEPVSSPGLGMGAASDRALSPLPELRDLGDEELRAVDTDEHHGMGSVKPEYAQHPNGSDGWLPAENVPTIVPAHMQTHGQNHDQNLNTMPQPNTMPAVPGGSPNRIASPIARVGSPIRDKNETNLPQHAFLDDGQGYTNGHLRQTTGGTSIRSRHRDSPSPGRAPIGTGSASLARSASRKSTHTASDGRPIPGSAFVNGAGTTGPFSTAEENEELLNRRLEANASLTPKQRSKIAKNEGEHVFIRHFHSPLVFVPFSSIFRIHTPSASDFVMSDILHIVFVNS